MKEKKILRKDDDLSVCANGIIKDIKKVCKTEVDFIKEVTISVNQLFKEIKKLHKEKHDLKNELIRLKEDKAENEATYEKIINQLKEELKNANRGLRRKVGGK